jgi:hypothetical protein
MLFRNDSSGYIAISQPAHSWVSGQLARHWGNAQFGRVSPREEVCLAAEMHDLGFSEWEHDPSFNSLTGRPHSFLDMPMNEHLAAWTAGVEMMQCFGRYPTLLVSLHNAGLCRRHSAPLADDDARQVKEFLGRQERIQNALITSLRNDALAADTASDEALERNRLLVAAWDLLSLVLCMGLAEERQLEQIPGANGTTALTLRRINHTPERVHIAPWPFASPQLSIVLEGKHLLRPCREAAEMRAQFEAAAPVRIEIELNPNPNPESP